MRPIRLLIRRTLVVAVLAAALSAPLAAVASPVRGDVLVGFGDCYSRAGQQFTHHGIDIAMEVGSSVSCVQGGRVTFAGRVPAGPGHSTLAATLEDPAGRLWSYMPLESLDVIEGQVLAEEDRVGTVAASGDGSCEQPHLHLGLRVGGEYADPISILGVAAPPQARSSDAVEQLGALPVTASPARSEAAPTDLPVETASPGEVAALVLENGLPAVSSREQERGAGSRSHSGFDPTAVAVRDRAQSWRSVQAAMAQVDVAASDTAATLSIAILGLALLGGLVTGTLRTMRSQSPAEVHTEPRSTRLQPR